MAYHVIEDDPGVADALVLMLRAFGHEATAFRDAESFLAAARPGPDDTLLVDLALPGMSGADLIRRLKHSLPSARVVVVTGQSQAQLEKDIRGLGVEHLVRKPVEADALRDFL